LKKGISYFKGGKKIFLSEFFAAGCLVKDKCHWKKVPLFFFSQNILNWRNVKIFSRTFLALP